MEVLDKLREVIFWSLLAINAVALYAAIKWPRVKGKAWLVAFLSIVVAQQSYFRLFDAVVRYTAEEPRYELYDRFETFNFLVIFSGVVAHVFLVTALFHLRSFFKASTLLPSAVAPRDSVSSAPTKTSWPAKGGTFLGPYRANGRSTVALAKDATLAVLEDDSLIVKGKYDPPGTLLYAFLATIGTGIFVAIMLAALGFAAGPGWLVWYVIILLIRRRQISLNVANAHSIVVDPATSRIAVHIPFEGRDRWFAIQLLSDFQSATKALGAAFPQKVTPGTVGNPSALPIVVLIALIFAIVAIIVAFAVR